MGTGSLENSFSSLHRLHGLSKKGVYFLYQHFLRPRAHLEDERRRELILNVLLCGNLLIVGLLTAVIFYNHDHLQTDYRGVPPLIFCALVFLFVALYYLSRKGYYKFSAYIFIVLFLAATIYTECIWGADEPTALLADALVITMSSILIGTGFSFIITLVIITVLIPAGLKESAAPSLPILHWKNKPLEVLDTLEFAAIFILLTVVSWLANREIVKSLRRAQTSEQELKNERDLLEIKIAERTQALKQAQLEKVTELDRFAEFGRLASGAFHDLMNTPPPCLSI